MEWSNELTIFLTAMTPIGELRAALPVAILAFKMDLISSYILSVIGNIVPVFFLLLFWRFLAKLLMDNFDFFNKFFEWLFERTRKKFQAKYEKWGKLALIIFVAIPLPITGAWTGSLAAWLFGYKYLESVGLIFLGILMSGVIVSLLILGGINLYGLIY